MLIICKCNQHYKAIKKVETIWIVFWGNKTLFYQKFHQNLKTIICVEKLKKKSSHGTDLQQRINDQKSIKDLNSVEHKEPVNIMSDQLSMYFLKKYST